jgi:hypothetical protein
MKKSQILQVPDLQVLIDILLLESISYGMGSFSGPGVELVVLLVVLGVDWGLAGSMLNECTLVILSLIGDLLAASVAPYLKVIVALVVPGAVALYVIPERFGLSINDCSPGFRVTCCFLHEEVVV